MEFAEVIRRRRMVRAFSSDAVPRPLVDRVLDAGLRAPSAGFSQGWGFVVLEEKQTEQFWASVSPDPPQPGGRWAGVRAAPVIILPLAHKDAYLARYAEPDKAGRGMDVEAGWPAAYWDIDVAFAVMSMLLAATDAGLGALFFAIFQGEEELLAGLDAPSGYKPIGALALGWPAPDRPSPSLARGRRPRDEVVHFGAWTNR
jgi:nitroreductase